MIIGATFLTLINTFGIAVTFWIYTGLNILFVVLTVLLIPETKGISLENIEKNLMEGKRLRDIGVQPKRRLKNRAAQMNSFLSAATTQCRRGVVCIILILKVFAHKFHDNIFHFICTVFDILRVVNVFHNLKIIFFINIFHIVAKNYAFFCVV